MSVASLWGNAQSAELFDARPSKDCVRKVAVEKLQRKERQRGTSIAERQSTTASQWVSSRKETNNVFQNLQAQSWKKQRVGGKEDKSERKGREGEQEAT
ncbi:Transmembrane channel-like protein 4 [Dissostichus eleginoides]|uniref:Transmembrane channel-like protein 4 n=1 Tax=Dissostichus eleginoides TaxID=100907 RepID=A0AAD9BKC5_DISEL|nr:Transmembrane channel-like protein 4 [Dissostichus eleginoides]